MKAPWLRIAACCVLAVFAGAAAQAQTSAPLAVAADSARWELEGRAAPADYLDDVSVFLNGKILYRGRSAQNFRDPAFLGIVDPENDAVWLPLKKGRNDLVLGLSELGGGWGFICRLAGPER